MAEAARTVADHLGIPLLVAPVTIRGKPSPEAGARTARYRALEGGREPAEWLLTGHTADDQAETVLGNFLRGTGAEGLAGIPRRRGRLVRPLLEVTRAETRELGTLLGIPWREDPANLSEEPRRNALRRHLIPSLEAQFNPGLRRALLRTARLMAADQRLLEQAAERVPMPQGEGPEGREGAVRLPAALLATMAEPVASRAVRKALRTVRGPHAGSAAEVEAVLSVARGERRSARLGGMVVAEREGAWVCLQGWAEEVVPAPRPLSFPGAASYGSWALQAWIDPSPPVAWPLSAWTAVFDADLVPPRAVVRAAGSGGLIAIGGGRKPLDQALAEAGVPPRKRSAWPVVEAAGQVLWVPGVRRAAWAWAGAATRRYLWASAESEGRWP